jgi:cytochrome c oxidase cbb3-type subunit III
MQSWEKTYSPAQIKNLSSFIKTLAGTNPPNAKSPQGDIFQEAATQSSTTKDSVSISK